MFTWYRYDFHSGTRYIFVPRLHWNADVCCTGMTLCEPSLSRHLGVLFSWSTRMRYSFQSTRLLISYRNEPCYRVYMIPIRNVVSLHTGTKLSYRYKNRSELVPVWLVPVRHFVPVSCKQIQSHKWEPGWTRTGMKVIPVSCKHPLSEIQSFATVLWQCVTIRKQPVRSDQ